MYFIALSLEKILVYIFYAVFNRPRGRNYLSILKFLISIYSKLYTRITNITLIFHQIPPCEQERDQNFPKS